MSTRQWQLLAATSYGIYATGMQFESRPVHILNGRSLTIEFENLSEFTDYTRRAFRIMATRLIAFVVQSLAEKSVTCLAIFNHTPQLEVVGSINDPSGDDSDVSVFSITPQRDLTIPF